MRRWTCDDLSAPLRWRPGVKCVARGRRGDGDGIVVGGLVKEYGSAAGGRWGRCVVAGDTLVER
jgi:hypothetical protein